MRSLAAPALVVAILLGIPAGSPRAQESGAYAIRVGKILTCAEKGAETYDNGVILVRNGKIEKIGSAADVPIPPGTQVLDAPGRWALPGFIDLHCHVGGSMRDINDMVHPTNPELSTRPTIDPDSDLLKLAVAGGVTTVLYIPGSGTNLSGFGTLMHTGGGKTGDELVVRFPGGMKVAQAWNPERRGGDLGASRMGMWWALRDLLDRAKAYHLALEAVEQGRSKLKPEPKPDLELMRGLFQRKWPVIIHTADPRDVMGTVRMFHDEYQVPCIITHGEFGGFKVASEIAKRGIPVNIGPRIYDFAIMVDDGKWLGIPTQYAAAGVKRMSFCTDSPVIPQEDLVLQASLAVRYGIDYKVALRGLTIEPAKAVLIDDRLGSLEAGKDADIVLWSGDPLDLRSHVVATIIAGKVVYDPARDGRRY